MRYAIHVSVIFAAEMLFLIVAHRLGIVGAGKWGGMVAAAWLGGALGEAALA